MRFANPFSSPVLFAAIIMVGMMAPLVKTSAKQQRADRHHHAHRRGAHHHYHAHRRGAHHRHDAATTHATKGTMTDASNLGAIPFWVCPNDGVCSNHSIATSAAANIGVCHDSHGNAVTPTRYCWVPTASHPTPTVQSPSCECSWPDSATGCVITSPAPSFYACKCSLGHKIGTCAAFAIPCTDFTNYQVSNYCYVTHLLETGND